MLQRGPVEEMLDRVHSSQISKILRITQFFSTPIPLLFFIFSLDFSVQRMSSQKWIILFEFQTIWSISSILNEELSIRNKTPKREEIPFELCIEMVVFPKPLPPYTPKSRLCERLSSLPSLSLVLSP